MVNIPKLCLLCLFCLSGAAGIAQQTTPVVINSAGRSFSNGGLLLEMNIGEVATFSTSPSLFCTSGFLQPDAGTTTSIPTANNVKLDAGAGIDNAGTSFTNGGYLLEFTIGEMASITLSKPDKMLTQGILQTMSTGNPLPVAGLEFTAKRVSPLHVELRWKTIQEQHNSGFQVERKKENENKFTSISFVKSLAPDGNSSLPLEYQKTDTNNYSAQTWYRLRQVDEDGSSTYSVIRVVNGLGTQATVLKAWPVPSSGPVNVLVTGINDDDKLHVYDLSGKKIQTMVIKNNSAVSLNGLRPGVYIIRLEQHKDFVQKIMIQ